jgi:hypothetical protein
MALALWCDDPDKGHAFDEREVIVVDPDGGPLFFCKAHSVRAFATAFHMADTAGRADILVPALGGAFTVMPAETQAAPAGSAGDGAGQSDPASDGSKPGKSIGAAAAGTSPQDRRRRARAVQSAQAIADLLEQEPQPGGRTPAQASYGGRP